MGVRLAISDRQWIDIAPRLAAATRRGPKGRDDRSFFEAILWILRTGAPWRDQPCTYGKWSRSYRRFRRWALAGRWEVLRTTLRRRDRVRYVLIDSTIVKAHPHAAGALRKTGGQAAQALGRSRGGLTTKLQAAVSERGELLRYVVTAGQVNDVTQACLLTDGTEGEAVVGDRAYDGNAVIAHVEASGRAAVIPPSNRRTPRVLDSTVYRVRNVIERWFGRLKGFRRVATRYEKTLLSYAGVVATAAFVVALSGWRG
jgi:transposase